MQRDIFERDRRYRNALNRFLMRMRMGCLQKSVFVSVRDIRPLFYDLDIAAAVAEYANFFEAWTVLGQSDAAVVARAWDFEGLRKIQADYIEACQARLRRTSAAITFSALPDILCAELAKYRAVMHGDLVPPFTRSCLHNPGYFSIVGVCCQIGRRLVQEKTNGLRAIG